MAAILQGIPLESETESWLQTPNPILNDFFRSLASARESALLLDFDGTLAPFRIDPSQVRPWGGVVSLIDKIQASERTRIVVVSGRPARDATSRLGLNHPPEVWGLHGAERLYPDGHLETEELPSAQDAALIAAKNAIHAADFVPTMKLRIEEKWNSVAVHWRGRSPHTAKVAREQTLLLLSPFSHDGRLTLLQFDGGIELRAGRNKGDAVRQLLQELPPHAPVAYLGDDVTDEDAFRALGHRGLGLLVRRALRPSAAQVWLRPPEELRGFLNGWLRAVTS